jgi:hypothetical protein
MDLGVRMREEQNFFTKELEKLDMTWADMGAEDNLGDLEQVEGWG